MIYFGMIIGFIFIVIFLWIAYELIKELFKREKAKNYTDSSESLMQKRYELKQRINHYKIDKQYVFGDYVLGISYYNRMFICYKTIHDSREQFFIRTLPFSSIVDCKVMFNNDFTVVGKNTENNLSSLSVDRDAVIEKLLGDKNSECNSMQICFITNDYEAPAFIVDIVSSSIPRYTSEYKQICNDVYEIFVLALKIIEAQ